MRALPLSLTDVFLFLQLLHFSSSLSLPSSRSRSYSSESDFLVSPRLFSSGPLPFPHDLSLGNLLPSISPFFVSLSPTLPVSPSCFLCPARLHVSSLPSLAPGLSLPTSRWSALDPTRYRPHSRAQMTRQRYMYMHSRVHRSPPQPLPSPLQSRSAARTIALLREVLKSHNCDIHIRDTRDRPVDR